MSLILEQDFQVAQLPLKSLLLTAWASKVGLDGTLLCSAGVLSLRTVTQQVFLCLTPAQGAEDSGQTQSERQLTK